jgi:hypothetical protein
MDLIGYRRGIIAKPGRANEHLWTLTEKAAEVVVTGNYGPESAFERRIPERDGKAGLACRADLPDVLRG